MDQIIKLFPELTPLQIAQFKALQALYGEWNAKINVISRKDFDNFYIHHVLHSLAIAKTELIENITGVTVLDVGCGGGFPVVPLSILLDKVRFTACDSIGKKIRVVNEVVQGAHIKNITAVNCRAEVVEGEFDWVVSRAVTDLQTFVGWTWEKTKNGILYLKGGDLTEEIAQAGKKTQIFEIKNWFDNDFFETKKVLHVKK